MNAISRPFGILKPNYARQFEVPYFERPNSISKIRKLDYFPIGRRYYTGSSTVIAEKMRPLPIAPFVPPPTVRHTIFFADFQRIKGKKTRGANIEKPFNEEVAVSTAEEDK